jgi:hypothetical protein
LILPVAIAQPVHEVTGIVDELRHVHGSRWNVLIKRLAGAALIPVDHDEVLLQLGVHIIEGQLGNTRTAVEKKQERKLGVS